MAAHLETDKFRLYPDPTAGVLTKALAEFYHVAQEQIFVGVGSDDVLAMAFQTFFNSEKPIFFPDITYSFYPVWRMPLRSLMRQRHWMRIFGFERKTTMVRTAALYSDPNAPTSVYEDLDFVEDILKHNRDVLVIVDEAYIDFGRKIRAGLD